MYSPIGAAETPRDGVICVAPTGLLVIGIRYPGLTPGPTFVHPAGASLSIASEPHQRSDPAQL